MMDRGSLLVGLAIGLAAFGVTWATVRHFTGLAQEHGSALAIAIGVGLVVALGYAVLDSRLFDLRRRRKRR